MIALSRLRRPAALALVGGLLLVAAADGLSQQKKPQPSTARAEELMKPGPRPKKDPLPASKLPLEFAKGERVAFVGNTTAERMSLYGHFEAMLHLRHKDKQLVVRNFGFPADEVGVRQRSNDYTKLDDPLFAFNPDTFLCFFGWNESFKGAAGVEKFKADYEKFLDDYTAKYPRDDAKSPPRFVLVSPIAFENTGDKFLPDGQKENENLKLYTAAVKAVAEKRKLAFVDVFTPTLAAFEKGGGKLTVGGFQMTEAGDKLLAQALDAGLFGSPLDPAKLGTSEFEKLRAAINDKSWIHHQDYRMVNGWYVYGGRRTYDTETFPREYAKLRNMVAVRDQYAWDIANGKQVPDKVDDSKTGDLIVPPTRFGGPDRKYSENPPEMGPKVAPPEELIKGSRVPAGFKLELFASEKEFPDLAKPVQINFDSKGRLWVACMPTYPQWKPGDPKPGDKLIILEDTNGDGKADKCKVFTDKLQCPTGFEFFNGGVLVVDQPRLLFLKDTDGDDKADETTYLMDGWATDDTHHTCGAWEWNHGGLLHMLEGIATSTTLETPWGPHRSAGSGGAYVLDPRSLKIRQFALPSMANMWCYVFDEWGNGIVGDGTGSFQTWDTPLSGQPYSGRKGVKEILPNGVRPNLGNEFLVSRALPKDVQGNFTYACVINLNGLTHYKFKEDGAFYVGERIKAKEGGFDDLVRATDKHFRPADPQIGPDGALFFGDWANPLIGHMQYSQRDPNRDHVHGRVYRMIGVNEKTIKPVTQHGKSVAEICEQFREYEWRTRYRARRELHDRPAAEVLPAVAKWAAELKPTDPDFDRLRCEALWVQAGHHAVDMKLADAVLAAKTFQARAAVIHLLADERAYLPAEVVERFKKATADEHLRVRTEAARALSFYPTADAASAIADIAKLPMDYWTRYTVEASLSANVAAWPADFYTSKLAAANPEAAKVVTEIQKSKKLDNQAAPWLATLLSLEPKSPEERNKAMRALADMKGGDAAKGRIVFTRLCVACHRVGADSGAEFGPNLDKVMERSKGRYKLVESIIDPNAEVEDKYKSTRIDKTDGKSVVGLLVSESKTETVIFDGKAKVTIKADEIDRKTQLKQSSMPEGQAGTMAPSEFLDLIEYLSTLK
ncbi:MAG: c-type cytochrome [Fimbriiglobus sp.]|jgi:putative heme-binding domain-containing protein|nr:c-type cytochrome [Fimbriiglobus sp.]